jgi:hypothetical protein
MSSADIVIIDCCCRVVPAAMVVVGPPETNDRDGVIRGGGREGHFPIRRVKRQRLS